MQMTEAVTPSRGCLALERKETCGVTSTETVRLIGDREQGGKGVRRWGEREIIYPSLHCHHQNDSCMKMGSDESQFNVS